VRGVCFSVFVVCCLMGTLVGVGALKASSCQENFQRLAGAFSSETQTYEGENSQDGVGVRVRLEEVSSEPVRGGNSLAAYRPEAFGLFLLRSTSASELHFVFRPSEPDLPTPLIEVAVHSHSTHRMTLNFPRKPDGTWVDVNLVQEALEHLSGRAQSGESFLLSIEDPYVVDQLNGKLGQLIQALTDGAPSIDYPRRAQGPRRELPLAEPYSYRSNRDSYFPVLPQTEANLLFRSLHEELDLSGELTRHFFQTGVGKQLDNPDWAMEVVVEGMPPRPKQQGKGVDLPGVMDLNPYVYRFVLRITKF